MKKQFLKGMDMSTLIEMEECGARYFDEGRERDVLEIMRAHDISMIRLRLYLDPKDEAGNSYGAGHNDLATMLQIGKRVTEAGFSVLLNLHYSDFWADPGKQIKPKAWADLGIEELVGAVYIYTKETLETFLAAGINVQMVQVGNEITNGLLWPEGKLPEYENCARLISAGIRACRDVNPLLKVMIHLDNGGNNELYRRWFDNYFRFGTEDFDCIGMSYYPFWHGSLKCLEDNMNDIAARYHKDIYIAEVSMGFTMEDYAEYEGLQADERKGYATKRELVEKIDYPMTSDGQRLFMLDFMNRVAHVAEGRGKGFFWWEPAWIPIPGSGWATEASLDYMNDPGPCGNEWANQCLFDYDGNVNSALKAIRDFSIEL